MKMDGMNYLAEISFFNKFPAGKRKDITFHTTFTKPDGTKIPLAAAKYVKASVLCQIPAGGQHEVYLVDACAYDPICAALLVYAEAQARTEASPNAQAYASVNAVRKRAGLADLSGLSRTAFIDAVVDERAWSLPANGRGGSIFDDWKSRRSQCQ